MRSLYIAEKPSVGKAIAEHLRCYDKADGYIEGPHAIVTWCRGHLVNLSMPDAYGGSLKLPIFPEQLGGWRWETSSERGAAHQLGVIRSLLRRPDVGLVMNCCDPDREGEGIFRRVIATCRYSGPVRRLWATSLEDDALSREIGGAKDSGEYDGLAAAADARAKADWLVGMNASRAFRCSVGRVRTPTLQLVVSRDRQIESFRPEAFWQVVLEVPGMRLKGERLGSQAEAERRRRAAREAIVRSVERRRIKSSAPRLLSTTDLQMLAFKALGLSPKSRYGWWTSHSAAR